MKLQISAPHPDYLQLPLTFCLWDGWRRSPKGEVSGWSKAKSAKVLSSSLRMVGSLWPLSARWSWAYTTASSILPSRINSIRTCCCWWKTTLYSTEIRRNIQLSYNIHSLQNKIIPGDGSTVENYHLEFPGGVQWPSSWHLESALLELSSECESSRPADRGPWVAWCLPRLKISPLLLWNPLEIVCMVRLRFIMVRLLHLHVIGVSENDLFRKGVAST